MRSSAATYTSPLAVHGASVVPRKPRECAQDAAQNVQDRVRVHNAAELRQPVRTALATNDNTIEVPLFARSEMPEDIKTLQRALERVVEDGLDAEETTAAAPVSPAR